MLFLATTINYMDRQVIGVLKPNLMKELGWSEIDFSNVVFAFQVAYAAGYLFVGRLIDRLGVRVGLGLAVVAWSLAAMAHGLARTVVGFATARFWLGLSEGGNFPAAIRAVSYWFPKRERALATGLFNAGSNVGALITPLAVPWLTVKFGWPMAFYATGAIGLLWLVGWLAVYRDPERHPRVGAAELALIRSDPPDPPARVPWLHLLRHRPTWAVAAGMFLTAPVWWFYLYWVPGYLHDEHGLSLLEIGPPLVVIYLLTDVGSIGGGWISSRLIKIGWSVDAARKTAFLVCALCVLPVFAVSRVSNLWVAVVLIGVAAAAHQGFSANLYTLASDTMPRGTVASVVGFAGMCGAIGGMLAAKIVGYVLEWTHNYALLFGGASVAYLVALGIIHLLVPRIAPVFPDTPPRGD